MKGLMEEKITNQFKHATDSEHSEESSNGCVAGSAAKLPPAASKAAEKLRELDTVERVNNFFRLTKDFFLTFRIL